MKHLNSLPARTDLTDREIVKVLSATCGGLANMADVETVRDAVRWLAECDQMWEMMKEQKRVIADFEATR